MKEYYLALEVPDDFDPEQLGIELDYPEEVEIKSEGELDQLIDFEVELKEKTENSVAVIKFPVEAGESSRLALSVVENKFGIPAIGIVNDFNLLVENADEAVKMLEGMIQKIKSASIRKQILER